MARGDGEGWEPFDVTGSGSIEPPLPPSGPTDDLLSGEFNDPSPDSGSFDGDLADDMFDPAFDSVAFNESPFDDSPAFAAFGTPPSTLLPRADRLWRHPSELKFEEQLAASGPSKARSRLLVSAAVAGAVAGGLVVMLATLYWSPTNTVTERVVERQAVVPATLASVGTANAPLDVVAIADRARPSIVRIEVLGDRGRRLGTGSGVIIRDDGHAVTNAHVVQDSARLEAVLADGRRFEAVLIGTDSLTDIAVVKLTSDETFPTALLGSTTGVRVGEPAIAIGSPLGLSGGPSVTVGIISAVGRELEADSGPRLYDLVQTDAPIMPGSSGGALLDRHGAVLGITTAVAVSDVGREGLGFAIPIEVAHGVATDLIELGRARHGYLGIDGADLPTERARELGIDGGSIIGSVETGSPAHQAGLQSGDIVVAVDGLPTRSMSSLVVTIRLLEPGSTLPITVMRDGQALYLDVTVGERR